VMLTKRYRVKRLNLKKLRALMKMPAAMVDLTGTIESKRVERYGFAFGGLGSGVEKK
jgi:hypothetical protein